MYTYTLIIGKKIKGKYETRYIDCTISQLDSMVHNSIIGGWRIQYITVKPYKEVTI